MAVVIIPGTNSWITLAEANAYIEEIPGSSSWTTLTPTEQSQYIITAYRKIYFAFTIGTVTEKLKYAQAKFAYWLSQYMTEWEKRQALYASGVRSFSLPGWSETLESVDMPEDIKDILSDSLSKGAYFGNVSRDLD